MKDPCSPASHPLPPHTHRSTWAGKGGVCDHPKVTVEEHHKHASHPAPTKKNILGRRHGQFRPLEDQTCLHGRAAQLQGGKLSFYKIEGTVLEKLGHYSKKPKASVDSWVLSRPPDPKRCFSLNLPLKFASQDLLLWEKLTGGEELRY